MYTFGSEWFPHHRDNISQVLSAVSSGPKKTYQIQVPNDEIKFTKFPDQVSYLYDTSPTKFPDFVFSDVKSVLVMFDISQFTCKGRKTWTTMKIIGVSKFICHGGH